MLNLTLTDPHDAVTLLIHYLCRSFDTLLFRFVATDDHHTSANQLSFTNSCCHCTFWEKVVTQEKVIYSNASEP